MEKQHKGTLTNAVLNTVHFDRPVVQGNIEGHPDFPDGSWIHTSAVLRIDFENKVIETLNSKYTVEWDTRGYRRS